MGEEAKRKLWKESECTDSTSVDIGCYSESGTRTCHLSLG